MSVGHSKKVFTRDTSDIDAGPEKPGLLHQSHPPCPETDGPGRCRRPGGPCPDDHKVITFVHYGKTLRIISSQFIAIKILGRNFQGGALPGMKWQFLSIYVSKRPSASAVLNSTLAVSLREQINKKIVDRGRGGLSLLLIASVSSKSYF
jgi:hypothetical protein